MSTFGRSFLAGLLSCCLMALPLGAQAGVIGTSSFADNSPIEQSALSQLQQRLQGEELSAQLLELGVDPAQLEHRLANLTEAEIAQINGQLDQLPAGAGVVELVGVVFIVLLILELVGVTNIFKSF